MQLSHKFYSGRMSTVVPAEMYCESVFFPVAQVVMELLSEIKVFLISMVALKMLMPQTKTKNRPKRGNGYKFILSVTIILGWILHSCHRNSAVAVQPSWLLQIFWGGHVGPPYWESFFFTAAEVAI